MIHAHYLCCVLPGNIQANFKNGVWEKTAIDIKIQRIFEEEEVMGITGEDGHTRRNFSNPGRKCVSWGALLLLAFMFLAAALPAAAGKHSYAELSIEIREDVLEILKKYGMPVARDRETPWFAIDGRPGHYSIIFYRADEIQQGAELLKQDLEIGRDIERDKDPAGWLG